MIVIPKEALEYTLGVFNEKQELDRHRIVILPLEVTSPEDHERVSGEDL